MELTEFLLARIAEDEARFRTSGADGTTGDMNADYIETLHERLLAECEAKRRIFAAHTSSFETLGVGHRTPSKDWVAYCGFDIQEWPCKHARLLAMPYADHPDYRDEWRP